MTLDTNEVENIFQLSGIILVIFWFEYKYRKEEEIWDEETIMPSDYAIIVKDIPKDIEGSYMVILRDFFEE